MIVSYTSKNPQETISLGEKIGSRLNQGVVFAVYGDLGAGKTLLAAAIARGMGIKEPITSPTFIYYQSYPGKIPFYHLDGYRLELLTYEDKVELGVEECFQNGAVTFVEWPQYVAEFLPQDRINIGINRVAEEDCRELTFDFNREKHQWLWEVLV